MLELGIGQGPRGPAGVVPEKGVMPNQQDAPLARILLSKKRASTQASKKRASTQASKKRANVADKQGLCQHSRHAFC